MIPVSTAGNNFGKKSFFVSTFLDKYNSEPVKFEKFDLKGEIYIEKLVI